MAHFGPSNSIYSSVKSGEEDLGIAVNMTEGHLTSSATAEVQSPT
jgi:hypothetical protein